MRAIATTATGSPGADAQRLPDGRPGDLLPVGGDEHRRRLRRLLVELPPSELPPDRRARSPRTRSWRRHCHSSVSACIVDRLGMASGVTTVGPGVSPRSMPPGEPRTSGMASEVSIPRRLSLSLRHQ